MTPIAGNRPKVGVGVLVCHQGAILLGQRKNAHGEGFFAAPGGHLEFGETPIDCAIRELKEETGLRLHNPRLGPYTNDMFVDDQKHYLTIYVIGEYGQGEEIQLLEPQKCTGWGWYMWEKLPDPLFIPLQNLQRTGFTPFG